MCYETILNIVYPDLDISNIKSLDVFHYQQFMQKWHSKDYVDNIKKMEKVAAYIKKNKVEVIFLQENK